ncbi:MAG TPA: xylulokinase [Anaerolineales bacterium]|nr:xylulokinase [Anaerolineales bacterium]
MQYVIGCDIGSQSLKAVLISAQGKICGEASASYLIEYPQPTWAQQSPASWMDALAQSVRSLLTHSDVTPRQIIALGLDAQVDGVVAIDKSGQPLYPAIIWMDRRAVSECENVGQKISRQAVFQITGLNLDATHVAAKIRWLANHEPHLFEKTTSLLLPGSYVAFVLTGELGVDYSNASSTMLMDVRSRAWSQQMCNAFEIPMGLLPPIYPATQVLGTLHNEAAELLGLSTSTKVILGSGDEHAACLGAGVTKPGLVCDIAGTAEPVCTSSQSAIFDESGLVETHCHADPDLWLLENPGFVSGANYRWFRDQFSPQEMARLANAYALLDDEAETIAPGSEGLLMLPCLMGAMTPTWNAMARGTFMGFTLAHRHAHFCRAILEASAYAIHDITDQMLRLGLPLQEIRAVGGGARSPLWRQIKADVTGLPVSLTDTIETTALGAGILALTGSGLIDSLDTAVSLTTHVIETRAPHPETHKIYEEYYQLYRASYFSLLPVFEQAARINS